MKINSLPHRKYTGPSIAPNRSTQTPLRCAVVHILCFAQTAYSLTSYNFQKKQRLFSWTARTQWPM